MADELLNEGADAPATDDLRSTIVAAIEQQREAKPVEAEVQPEGDKPQRARDEAGRFATQEKPEEGKEAKPAPQAQQKQEASQETPQPEQTAIRPPPGWSPKSKAAFDALPAEVKADIAKRETEVNQGLAKLQDYKGIERFAEQARSSGTTLEGALTNYTNWEGALRRDPVAAIMHLAGNLQLQPQQLAQAILQRAGAPQNAAIGGEQNAVQIHPALLQKIAQLESSVTAQEADRVNQQRQAVAQNVETFFADPKNKYADNVSDLMVSLINQAKASGQKVDLPSIYDTACWMHPEVRQLLINERAAAPQSASDAAKAATARAQQAAKAVTGAPARGVTPGSAPPQNESLRDTIKRAIADQRAG